MHISTRLYSIAEKIEKCNIICDIGTDHALLPIYLIKANKANKIFAVDLNKKPLKNAKKNLKKYNVQKYVELINSDGLNWYKNDIKIDICIISGIGGKKIIEILQKDTKNIDKYIFCPSNNDQIIRKWIKKRKFFIEYEKIISDNDILYIIIKVNKFSGYKIKNFRDEIFGPYLRRNKSKEFFDYWTLKFSKINNYFYNIPKKNKNYKLIKKELKLINNELKNKEKYETK